MKITVLEMFWFDLPEVCLWFQLKKMIRYLEGQILNAGQVGSGWKESPSR